MLRVRRPPIGLRESTVRMIKRRTKGQDIETDAQLFAASLES
jgi:hypothetical protein